MVSLTISLTSAYPGQDEGLQWTLNVPAGVTSVTTTAGDAANAAGKTLYCANQICLLAGMNTTPISSGVVGVVSLTLSPSASGNLPIQLSNPVEALANGEGGVISTAAGSVSVTSAVSVGITPLSATLTASQTAKFTATVTGSANTAVTWTMSPAVGTLSTSGLYTAPSNISATQTVTITATSSADPTKSASATVTLVPPVSVTLNPASTTLSGSQTQQFTANVAGSTNTAVIWTMNPAVGTLSTSGLYSAPSSISATQTVTITATSSADSTKSASATVTLVSPVSVTLNPVSSTLYGSQSQQFTASVTGSSNTAVTWTLSPSVGTLSAGGLYTAPSSISSTQTVKVTATSVADPTQSSYATVTLFPPVSVSLSPGSVSLGPTQSQQFTATVANTSNVGVAWSLSPAVGSISNGLYTAPASIVTAQTVTVTATSNAAPTKFASSTVSLTPPVTLSVSPSLVSLGASQTQTFTALVTNATNTAVTWSLVPAVGSISATGVYSAPASIPSAQTVTVIATSVADPTKLGSAAISLVPAVSVTVSPAAVSLTSSRTQQFTATVSNSTNTGVTWTLNPALGSISNGLYTAPSSISNAQTVTVTATSAADPTKFSSAVISLVPPVSVSLTPASVSLAASQTQMFAATVSNASNSSVTWALSPAIGSISNGLYTAPSSITTAQSVTVTASSVADPTKSASSTVSLSPPVSVAVSPSSIALTASQTQTFTATVVNSPSNVVTWSLSPVVGAISSTGVYSAPATISSAQTITVIATSSTDPTKVGTAAISLIPPVSVSLSPSSVSLTASKTQQFTATVSNSANTGVTWTLNPAAGSISNGLYTAPSSISNAQTVTVTATSAADPTKFSSAIISLVPPVLVSLTPASVSLAATQTQMFAATVSNAANSSVTWALSPAVGAISNGLYTAPATIAATQNITVSATSVADPTKSATATITLLPQVSISITPNSATLLPLQIQQLTATVLNTTNTGVAWTMNPAIGSLFNGVYTAPTSVAFPQSVTVTATSMADPTKSASAAITIIPAVSITLNPASVTLSAAGTQQFSAAVSNSSNQSVTWTMSPSIGTLSTNGLYTAPSGIVSWETVTIIATSVADTTKSASSVVTLSPSTTLTVSPGTVSLLPSQKIQFKAKVGKNVGIIWSILPMVNGTYGAYSGTLDGSISPNGQYVAPRSISSPTTIIIKATSMANPAVWGTATITLVP